MMPSFDDKKKVKRDFPDHSEYQKIFDTPIYRTSHKQRNGGFWKYKIMSIYGFGRKDKRLFLRIKKCGTDKIQHQPCKLDQGKIEFSNKYMFTRLADFYNYIEENKMLLFRKFKENKQYKYQYKEYRDSHPEYFL